MCVCVGGGGGGGVASYLAINELLSVLKNQYVAYQPRERCVERHHVWPEASASNRGNSTEF